MKEDAGFLMKFIKNDRENLSHSCDLPFDYSHSFVPMFFLPLSTHGQPS